MKKRWVLVATSCAVFLLSFTYYINAYRVSDTVQFGGDSWEYQSYAVNLVHGHGYKIGGEEPFETYKFGNRNASIYYPPDEPPQSLNSYFDSGGRPSFYRAPGYPFFLAGIYGLFGVHPEYAQIAQMLLLAIIASAFPGIGYLYWRGIGLAGGVGSALLFVPFYSPNPTHILTEPLTVFALAVWAFAFIYWEREERSKLRAFLLGTVSGAMILTKGVTIFIPILFLLYLVCKARPVSRLVHLAGFFLLGLGCLLIPWGLYAYQETGTFVMVSTQGETLLIDSNNEDCLNDGLWHSGWRKQYTGDERYLANRPEYRSSSAFLITLRFWLQNWDRLPRFFYLKLKSGFGELSYLAVSFSMCSFYLLALLAQSRVKSRVAPFIGIEKIPLFPLLYFLNILIITLLFYGSERFVIVFMGFFLIPAICFPISLMSRLMIVASDSGSIRPA